MLIEKLNKKSFLILYLISGSLICSFFSNCDDPDPRPGVSTGAYHASPEDSVVQIILNEFSNEIGDRIAFHEGSIDGFLNVLQNQLNTFGHVDYVGFYSNNLERLNNEGWIQPLPAVNESSFTQESIDALKLNNQLYGIPIYTLPDGRVKAIGLGRQLDLSLEGQTFSVINHLASSNNSLRIAQAAKASAAISKNRPDLVIVPDQNQLFCIIDKSALVVTIRNDGISASSPCITNIQYDGFEPIFVEVPTLSPGVTFDIRVEIPGNCFNPDCDFEISVDIENVVNEIDENNNFAKGSCLG